jgi:hypothetical protein
MARKAGIFITSAFAEKQFEQFAALVRADAIADEREACAKVCDIPFELDDWEIRCGADGRDLCNDLAAKIRARDQK